MASCSPFSVTHRVSVPSTAPDSNASFGTSTRRVSPPSQLLPRVISRPSLVHSGGLCRHSRQFRAGKAVASERVGRQAAGSYHASKAHVEGGLRGVLELAASAAEQGSSTATAAASRCGTLLAAAALSGLALAGGVDPALARPEGVNRPELLPSEFTRVIDVAGFLSPGQEERLSRDLERLEDDTGFKVRVLAQNYPETPGLAIKDYWGVDDSTVVFVADPSMGNILNFNVGANVDLYVPRSFWSRLAGKYGTIFFWREKGEDVSIESAVIAIDACLREAPGPRQCSVIQ